ncbi:DUF2336 domain-containing protein [Niveispirillum sp.]|uniref:DUF2336 domain-containing protein n=1 Tax=Niveispirillum sp. TaxID=1917217 RepID=UPI001B6E08C7|nr:DUF2336 domain-containing protein [Niveispirillum sp.]MBP7336207.1 DUF2336 domain-containing protein [Niveispirillum sp.]
MNESREALTAADVQYLAGDRTPEARIQLLTKLMRTAEQTLLADSEQALVRDLLFRLAHDTARQVREAVAWQIYNSPLLSDDLAHDLAMDVISVAFPLLRHTDDLDDSLLLEVIGKGQADKQLAIAARRHLSPDVADALAEMGNLAVIATLVGNEGADLSNASLLSVADRYAHVPMVAEPLAGRAVLPASVVERLVAYASERVRDMLVERHRLSPVIAAELAAHGRDGVTLTLLRPVSAPGMDSDALAAHLHEQGRLGVALLLRSLCSGDFDFFAAAIAAKSRVRKANALSLLLDGKWDGMKALLDHAHVPKHLFAPFHVAMRVAKALNYRGGTHGQAEFQTEALGRIYAECGQSEERAMDNLLLQLFDRKEDAMVDAAMDVAGMPFIPLRGSIPAR